MGVPWVCPMSQGRDTPWCLHLLVLLSWDAWSWGWSCLLCAPGLMSLPWQDPHPCASPCTALPAAQYLIFWM